MTREGGTAYAFEFEVIFAELLKFLDSSCQFRLVAAGLCDGRAELHKEFFHDLALPYEITHRPPIKPRQLEKLFRPNFALALFDRYYGRASDTEFVGHILLRETAGPSGVLQTSPQDFRINCFQYVFLHGYSP